ncbi:MAG: hypothetical protein AB1394_13750, partial [Bacteroidota bacterium]
LVTQNSLKAFLGSNSFLTNTPNPDGYEDAVKQADAIALGKIGMKEAELKEELIPLVQFCACAHFVYITSFQQSLSEEEIKHREKLIDRADKLLDDIAAGKYSVSKPSQSSSSSDTASGFIVYDRNEVV